MQAMPTKPLEHLALTNACGVEAGEPGKVGATQVNAKGDVKENLKQFIDSTHQKASLVVTWLGTIDEKANDRCKKLLCSIYNAFSFKHEMFV